MVFVVIVVRCLYPRKTLKTRTVLLVLADVSAFPAIAVGNRLLCCAAGFLCVLFLVCLLADAVASRSFVWPSVAALRSRGRCCAS